MGSSWSPSHRRPSEREISPNTRSTRSSWSLYPLFFAGCSLPSLHAARSSPFCLFLTPISLFISCKAPAPSNSLPFASRLRCFLILSGDGSIARLNVRPVGSCCYHLPLPRLLDQSIWLFWGCADSLLNPVSAVFEPSFMFWSLNHWRFYWTAAKICLSST